MRVVLRRLSPALLLSLAACEPPGPPAHRASDALQACAAKIAPVTTIVEATRRINALPAPADVPCFVASLPRPLEVVATTGITSAQPAVGKKSPRIFLLLPGLVVSVVPEGLGAPLLEFGEWVTPARTLKGELELPPAAPLADDAAFARIRYGNPATTCGLCHREEAPHDALAGAHVSLAYQPQPGSFVTARDLALQHEACLTAQDDSPRCALFHALFDFGAVRDGAFSTEVGLFAP